jgi:hypothetical protein
MLEKIKEIFMFHDNSLKYYVILKINAQEFIF